MKIDYVIKLRNLTIPLYGTSKQVRLWHWAACVVYWKMRIEEYEKKNLSFVDGFAAKIACEDLFNETMKEQD